MLFTIVISSVPDREYPVAEIWFGNNHVAELYRDSQGAASIEIYPKKDGGVWNFDLADWQTALERARIELNR